MIITAFNLFSIRWIKQDTAFHSQYSYFVDQTSDLILLKF